MCDSLATKNYCQLPVDWESNKFILKNVEVLVILTAIESLFFLTPSHAKGKISVPLEMYPHAQPYPTFLPTCPAALYLSFQFNNNNYTFQVALTACFRNWEISYTSIEFCWLICNEVLRPKIGHSNERIYRKPIDKRVKALLNEGSSSFL